MPPERPFDKAFSTFEGKGGFGPLHTQVAAALGWTDIHFHEDDQKWWGVGPYGGLRLIVPRFDASWCYAGPLVTKFNLSLFHDADHWVSSGISTGGFERFEHGNTPTEAVAKLIIRLKESELEG